MSEHDVARRVFAESVFGNCSIILFEDETTAEDLFPMAVLRPSWDIRIGAGCLRRMMEHVTGPGLSVYLRPRTNLTAMSAVLAPQKEEVPDPDADLLFVNGRLIGLWQTDDMPDDLPNTLLSPDGRVLLARRPANRANELLALKGTDLAGRLVQESGGAQLPEGWRLRYARYVWDYMLNNREVLERQLIQTGRATAELMGAHVARELPAGVSFADRTAGHGVYIGHGAKLLAGTVVGNQVGPVWIGPGTEIEPHTYLEGPLYIGGNCRIKAGARFYHGCSLGPHCRVAGEISASVIQGFSNKQHEGFLGNSILGQWVNLGADTRTSNLRNDYSPVKVQVGNRIADTGEMFVGLLCGDHAKTGINTMFNTGTVVGIGANVYGAGYPPRYVPSFAWGGADGMKPGSLERTLNSARISAERRGQQISSAEEELLRQHYAEVVNSTR